MNSKFVLATAFAGLPCSKGALCERESAELKHQELTVASSKDDGLRQHTYWNNRTVSYVKLLKKQNKQVCNSLVVCQALTANITFSIIEVHNAVLWDDIYAHVELLWWITSI